MKCSSEYKKYENSWLFRFSKQENIHIIVTIPNSHKKSWLSFAPKRVLFLAKVVFKG